MENRLIRWEELDMDCLASVFEKVGMESLVLNVPFVCKSWYKVSLSPCCWLSLDFMEILPKGYIWSPSYHRFVKKFADEYRIDESCFIATRFMKFVINRSRGHATSLSLPSCCSKEGLKYAADAFPGLKALSLPGKLLLRSIPHWEVMIEKWKNLESLSLESYISIAHLLSPISLHCNNFRRLDILGASVDEDAASSMVKLVPNIEHLSLRRANILRGSLITILRGCTKLVFLDVSGCNGFDEDDEEISKLASHMTNFSCQGSRSRLYFDSDYDDLYVYFDKDDDYDDYELYHSVIYYGEYRSD